MSQHQGIDTRLEWIRRHPGENVTLGKWPTQGNAIIELLTVPVDTVQRFRNRKGETARHHPTSPGLDRELTIDVEEDLIPDPEDLTPVPIQTGDCVIRRYITSG